ncbi:MAG: hypothetical protein KJ063_21150 [Anaerolineae bacterium]|nr:hypothetical protein [Anaerolineae bacterium]
MTAQLSGVDIDGIAGDLLDELGGLTPEDVWERYGNTRHGYAETDAAAYGLIEGLLEPYLDELRQCQKAGLTSEAEIICLGLLLGFYQFEHENKGEFKPWAAGAPVSFASDMIDMWRTGAAAA